jgi:ribosomal protein S18 acetylase RimI-like enzyme
VTVSIVPLAPSEAESLSALAAGIWRAHYPPIIGVAQTEYMLAQRYDPEVIRGELADGTVWWDTLRDGGEIVAFAASFPADEPGAVKLDKLYVKPERQRQGYGARLVAHVAQRARTLGFERLVLAVNRNNASAIAAYRKHGFEVVDAVVKDIGGGFVMDDYVMSLSVIPAPGGGPGR